MSKKTHGITVVRDTDKMQATFKLINKATEKVEDTLVIDWSGIHEGCRDFVSLYGMTKIVQDRESGTDMVNKLDAYKTCFGDTLAIGVLTRTRKSGGPTVRIEVEALAEVKKITVKQAQLLIRKYDKEDQEKIFASEQVQSVVKKMTKKVEEELDDDLLDDLLPED